MEQILVIISVIVGAVVILNLTGFFTNEKSRKNEK